MRIGRAAALTDTGRRRRDNEDAFVLEPPLFAVADGMGGAQAGELASRLAATTIEEAAGGARSLEDLVQLLQLANQRIHERAVTDPSASGMGTTATVVVVDEPEGTLLLGHVGDSRAYRIRAGALTQLTEDHSLVAELVRSGRLTEEEAFVHPARSVITRVLGTDPTVDVDTLLDPLEPDDVVVLCSDGLSSMLRDEVILTLVTEAPGPAEAVEALVAAANEAGGDDNVTVVVFEVLEGEPAERPAGGTPPEPAEPGLAVTAPPAEASAPAPPHDVRRHGAGGGSRWPALLLLGALVLIGALALWWSLRR